MHITRKTKCSQPASHLTLYGQPLEEFNTYKYLGLLLSSDLSWTQHINNVCTKAKKLFGLIYSCFYQFSTPASLLVRPNQYASQVRSPYKVGEVNSLEHVQKLHYVCARNLGTLATKNYFSCSPYQISSNAGFTCMDLCTMFGGCFIFLMMCLYTKPLA